MPHDPAVIDVDRAEIAQLFDALFRHNDAKRWAEAQALFIEGPLPVDMRSLVGGSVQQLTAAQLFAGFAVGLHAGKISHHMTSNVLITVQGDEASIEAHGYAVNFVPTLPAGADTWETWGVYRIAARRTHKGWRLASFAYDSRLTRGPDAVRTHVQASPDVG